MSEKIVDGGQPVFYDLIYAGGDVEGIIKSKYPQAKFKDASDFIHTERFECEIEGVTDEEFYPFAIREGFCECCLGFAILMTSLRVPELKNGPKHQETIDKIERWCKIARTKEEISQSLEGGKMSSIESCKYSNVILSTQELKFTVQEGYSLPLDQIIGLERAVPTDLSPEWEAFSKARWISYTPKFCHKYDAVPNQIRVNIMENMAVGKYQDIITLSASNGVAILPSPVVSIVLEVQPKPPPVKPLKIITATLPDGEVGRAYECQIEAEGGEPPYNWLCSALPDGLVFNSQTARITGIPLHSATSTFEIIVQDSSLNLNSYTMEYTLNITEPPLPPVKIVIMSPKGGEVWYKDDTGDITWVAENAGDETLDIQLTLDGVASIIATNVPVKSLGYLWTISGIPVSENAVIALITNYQTVQCPPFAIRERSGCAIPWPLAKALNKLRKLAKM